MILQRLNHFDFTEGNISKFRVRLNKDKANDVRSSLAQVCLTTSFLLCSLPIDLTAGSKGCQEEGLTWSRKPLLELPSGAAVAQLLEREHSVLKLHKNCKQSKWNPSDTVLTNPLLDCDLRRILLCTA